MKLKACFGLLVCLSFTAPRVSAMETKLTCPEVEATELKCKDYDAQTAACDSLVQAGISEKINLAKKELDECKKKHGMTYLAKCKKEMKNSTTAVNTPKQVASGPIQKELAAKPDTACAKAEAIGKEATLCKGPKKVLETVKANCIKV